LTFNFGKFSISHHHNARADLANAMGCYPI
jgi:hypothetical protein